MPKLPKLSSQKGFRAQRGHQTQPGLNHTQRGQGLVEALLALGILIILFHALASLIIAAYDLVGNSRTRNTGRHLALARMEEIRNLPYEDVGLIGGIPPGILQQTQSQEANGLEYTITTNVIFIDDPYDQLAPSDSNPSDYKRARVEVSWGGRFTAGESVVMVSDFSGEEPGGGGLLSFLVFDAFANPVSQADIHILNTSTSPQIDTTLQTDDNGVASLPGAPPCSTCYQITVTKENYSTDKTYGTEQVPNPTKPHLSVTEGQITNAAFTIDQVAQASITSTNDRSLNFSSLANKSFHLTGNKTIGTDNDGYPVYKYNQLLQTDSSGNLTLPNLEWDTYLLSLDLELWDLAGSNPLNPMVILPNSNLDIIFASSAHQENTLLLSITDASGSAIASASAHLTGPDSFDETFFTGLETDPDFGQAFFSPLETGTYTASISKSGYEPAIETFDVLQQTYYKIPLNPL